MKLKTRLGAGLACLLGALTLNGPAFADTTITAQVGPVTIPSVPVQVCINQGEVPLNECVTTPPAQTVALKVVVTVPTPAPTVTPPTINPVPCPAGTQGVALQINTGGADVVVGGTVTVIVIQNGVPTPVVIPIGPVPVTSGPAQTVTVFACAGITPGVPLPTLP